MEKEHGGLGVKHDIECLRDQYYLDPHPSELKIRNH